MDKVNNKVDSLALNSASKSDVTDLKKDLMNHVKVTVEPLERRLAELDGSHKALLERVKEVESESKKKKNHTTDHNTDTTNASMLMYDRIDPARKQVCVLYADNFTADNLSARLDAMRKYAEKFPQYPVQGLGPMYVGPKNKRSLSSRGFLEFTDEDTAREFAKQTKGECMVGGAKVQVRSAFTAVNRKRNYSLKTADSLVKQHLPKTAELTEIDWKARTVPVWTDREKAAKDITFTPFDDLELILSWQIVLFFMCDFPVT